MLQRDDYTCAGCGHRASKHMNVHHLNESDDHGLENLTTICVACHAVLHIGRNLSVGAIEIWESQVSQPEIVQRTREGIRSGLTLGEINFVFDLEPGPHPADSVEYANELLRSLGNEPRSYLSASVGNFRKVLSMAIGVTRSHSLLAASPERMNPGWISRAS